MISSEYVEPRSTTAVNVSCVENGRWEETEKLRPSLRAPISVMAAGFNFDSNKGMWVLDPKTRQERVWSQIERHENRSGKRVTNALTQIMDEDSKIFEVQKSVVKDLQNSLNVYPKQNGVLIALDGQPLLSEFFSNPEGIHKTVRKTLLAASFDAASIKQNGIDKEQVLKFLDEVRATKIHSVQEESWGTHLSGGTESLDTHLTKSADERVMRVSTINRSHKALAGI